jgi:branched-chain amino acid transport system substrate-binding protein
MIRQFPVLFRRSLLVFTALGLILIVFAACGNSSDTAGNRSTTPIKIGASLSLTGDFADVGKAYQQGYQLWADYVNAHGGLLGRKVILDILSDNSDQNIVQTNYQKLITVDKVDLILGPYSTLLTQPASLVVNRYGYAMIEGAGGGPSIFDRGLHNIFDVSLPVANNLMSFAQYILSFPASQRPTTAAYATEDDPFAQPQVDMAKQLLEQGGVKTVSYQVYPADTSDYAPIADKVIISNAQVVILGTLLPDCSAFLQRFRQLHYNPQAIIATSGPDEGSTFLGAVGGVAAAEGVMVPNGWYAQSKTPGSSDLVKAYIAKYGGTIDEVSAGIGESYSVGEVLYQAITKINSLDNAKLIAELHSGDTFQSVQGSVKFDSTGKNILAEAHLFQWQNGKYSCIYPASEALSPPEMPKPDWK